MVPTAPDLADLAADGRHRVSRSARTLALAAGLVVVLVVAALLVVRTQRDDSRARARSDAPAAATPAPASRAATPTPLRPACPATARPFEPTSIDVRGVGRQIAVLTPPRDAQGVPGTPPLTTAGKRVFAFDRGQGVRPGDRRGNVLLNAHTYPDGSALGNDLLRSTTKGDRIVVHGAAGRRLCYTVREVTQVRASQGFPAYYATAGRPQLAIIVCSGRRLGPGEWEDRTIFFASPGA